MKHILQRVFLLTLAMMLMNVSALAEVVSLDGTVTASYTYEIYSDSSATVENVFVSEGETLQAGDAIASLRTTKVYAEEDGTVTAVFANVGDLTDTVAERYGASIYLEGSVTYTITASTEKAYDSIESKLVHVGETVYLRGRTNESHVGTGVITAVDGTSYTVQVTEGDFLVGETVSIYRSESYLDAERVGRGDVARTAPITVTGTGRVIAMYANPGSEMMRGDLLMETLEGSGTSNVIAADVAGVVAAVNVAQGSAIEENAVAVVIWPSDAMQIEATVNETDLASVNIGDTVNLTFDWNADSGETMTGTVSRISAISDADSEDTVFTVTISFTPDESVRYGMNVTVTTLD